MEAWAQSEHHRTTIRANAFIAAVFENLVGLHFSTISRPGPVLQPPTRYCLRHTCGTTRKSLSSSFPSLGTRHTFALAAFFSDLANDATPLKLAVAVVLTCAWVFMAWSSRFGNWGGRFSPFGRSGSASNSNTEVSDADFSYITSEDLASHSGHHSRHPSRTAEPEIVEWDDKNPDRATDVLLLKHRRVSYPTHFPARSIGNGDLKIGTVRSAAAKKLGVADPARVRLFYRGRNMKYDDRPAREEGLRGDGQGSEILCVVGEVGQGAMAPGAEDVDGPRAWSVGSDEEDTEDASEDMSQAGNDGKKKRRNRGGKKKKGRKSNNAAPARSSNPDFPSHTPARAEFLPIPSSIPAPRPTSAPPAPAATNGPQTALQKLDTIASNFHTTIVPLCVSFSANPPSEKKERDFEHKKLTETILAQVLIKLDSVETGGDEEARGRRKALVKEAQALMSRLDEVVR
ncbi:uncharacterized protein BDZ99DRAFT_524921 [Mytilinidion resinicola]|uniref:BAG domain-containing protein n=1 Tax=Mytilinidion resinicola TaxID=574789 RepID=A0A6A6Y9H2_9PEZI|nr:uncharacterized protein BDZ99DRAFT_524921 [Mytilinidion resinicola]KAF2805208.1 hypothetical protein BDZ99DRAFT_524921 [Mytilinidion resinicola]